MEDQPSENAGFSTKALHAGRDPRYASTPIYMASTSEYFYTRGGNPTIRELEESVAALEGGRRTTATACGMAAVTQTLLTLLGSGDRIVCHRSVYDWTQTFLSEEAPRFGIRAAQVDMRDPAALESALKEPAKVVYFEPVSNPGLDVIDVPAAVEIAHRAGATVVVDNTFLTPALLRPLALGVDVVIHAGTKYLSGHGDALGGVITANDEQLIGRLRRARNIYGGVISPFNAFLILRGMSTLPARMKLHCHNAQKVAEFLSAHPMVLETRYPGLPGDRGHELAKTTFGGFGGMVGFVIKGGQDASAAFTDALELCKPWVSLGDVKTLVRCPEAEAAKGIPDGYVRISVGIEDAQDIIADLDQALNKAGR